LKTVAAAVMERDGRILACRRRTDQVHAGKWEFPGGKVEPGEEIADALRRELREELGIEARIGPEITRYEYAYPGKKPLLLVFYRVTQWTGEIEFDQFWEARWEPPQNLPNLDFLEGDVDFVQTLAHRR